MLTRDRTWHAEGVEVVSSAEEAIERANGAAELAVIGGAEIYRLVLPIADRIELTRVEADVPGDTVFPKFDRAQWHEESTGAHPADERNQYPMTFVTLDRKPRVAADSAL